MTMAKRTTNFMQSSAMPRAQKACSGSNRSTKDQARGGKGSGGGDKPLRVVVPGDQRIVRWSVGSRSTVEGMSVGAACDATCRQAAAGIGHGTPSQSSQLLQGAFASSRSVTAWADGTEAAATVMTPLANTARQARTAARARTRIITLL